MKNERLNKILELLTTDGKAEVIDLSQRFGVSQVTIRKDLSELEEQGLIERAHGFARLRSRDDVAGRLAYHFEAKKKIAARAATLVADGDTVMIESGSCCALLAEQLVSEKSDLTIITNSAFIADYIRRKESATATARASRTATRCARRRCGIWRSSAMSSSSSRRARSSISAAPSRSTSAMCP